MSLIYYVDKHDLGFGGGGGFKLRVLNWKRRDMIGEVSSHVQKVFG